MSAPHYELIDFGEGRKLESLGGYFIDRPSPAAQRHRKRLPALWHQADASFDLHVKSWHFANPWPNSLSVDCNGFRMPLLPTPFGHIGMFPEQSDNWTWLQSDPAAKGETRNALNLFAYTGASTMALIAAGYAVAHVDAARPNVQSARAVAQLNGWQDAPIRYLVDDAAKFVSKEVRRGRRYHTIVLDPPAYGHTPDGKAWRLERDIWPLLEDCLRLIDRESFRILLTGHSRQVDENDAERFFQESVRLRGPRHRADSSIDAGLHIVSGRSQLRDRSGRRLDAGFYVRVSRG